MTDKAAVEAVARAIAGTMFAPHELPLTGNIGARYRETAKAAITALDASRAKDATGWRDARKLAARVIEYTTPFDPTLECDAELRDLANAILGLPAPPLARDPDTKENG